MRDLTQKPVPSAVAPARYRVTAPPAGALGTSAWDPHGGRGTLRRAARGFRHGGGGAGARVWALALP
jgi:hypothetical protein